MYDLKSSMWGEKQFETIDEVSSIRFFFKENKEQNIIAGLKYQRFIVYSHRNNNLIVLANIDKGEIITKVNLTDVSQIYDLYVWNNSFNALKTYLIVAGKSKNCIKILDLEDLTVLKSKEIEDNNQYPVNIIKVLRREKGKNEYREGFVCCQDKTSSNNSINLYI